MRDRRSFLRDGLRWLTLGSLAAAGVVLGSRTGSGTASTACPPDQACRSCSRLAGCRDIRADRFRVEGSLSRPRSTTAGEGG